MPGSAFVDTNVVVYAFDDDEPAKQQRAREVLSAADGPMLILSSQVLAEFYVTVTRKLGRPLTDESAQRAVAELAHLPVVTVDADMVLGAIVIARQHQLSFWDAQIVQAATTAGCASILTEDLADGTVLAGVRIDNPFAAL